MKYSGTRRYSDNWLPLQKGSYLKWYDNLAFADILKDAAKLPPHSAILWHLMNVDAAGIAHEENELLNALASVASAPYLLLRRFRF